MESPDSWGPLERVISQAIHDADDAVLRGIVGLSHIRVIADALRDAGLVKAERDDEWEAAVRRCALALRQCTGLVKDFVARQTAFDVWVDAQIAGLERSSEMEASRGALNAFRQVKERL